MSTQISDAAKLATREIVGELAALTNFTDHFLGGLDLYAQRAIDSETAALREQVAVLQSQVDNADVNLEQVRMALKYNHAQQLAAKDAEIARLLKNHAEDMAEVEGENEEMEAALAAIAALKPESKTHEDPDADECPRCQEKGLVRESPHEGDSAFFCDNCERWTSDTSPPLKPVAEDSSVPAADPLLEVLRDSAGMQRAAERAKEYHAAVGPGIYENSTTEGTAKAVEMLLRAEKATAPATAQMPCCPMCGSSEHVAKLAEDQYICGNPDNCAKFYGGQYFTPQPEGGSK